MKWWRRLLAIFVSPLALFLWNSCTQTQTAPTTNVITIVKTNKIVVTNRVQEEKPDPDADICYYMGPDYYNLQIDKDQLKDLRKDLLI